MKIILVAFFGLLLRGILMAQISNAPAQFYGNAVSTLEIEKPLLVCVPNAFTPDDDDYNDNWCPVFNYASIGNFSVKVYNGYDKVIFESFDISNCWDGSFRGEECQAATYYWMMFFKDMDSGQEYRYFGHVNLIK